MSSELLATILITLRILKLAALIPFIITVHNELITSAIPIFIKILTMNIKIFTFIFIPFFYTSSLLIRMYKIWKSLFTF